MQLNVWLKEKEEEEETNSLTVYAETKWKAQDRDEWRELNVPWRFWNKIESFRNVNREVWESAEENKRDTNNTESTIGKVIYSLYILLNYVKLSDIFHYEVTVLLNFYACDPYKAKTTIAFIE